MNAVTRLAVLILCSSILFTPSLCASIDGWVGVWTYDLCHEDRKATHDKDTYCREGKDRIRVERNAAGKIDITLCPADPWGERNQRLDRAGRILKFNTRDGLQVRLIMGQNTSHYHGAFRSADGHAGRVWGRRVQDCR